MITDFIASRHSPLKFSMALALLHTGGALGNVIALKNIVMVKSVLHSDIREGKVIQNTIWVALGYSLLVIGVLQLLVLFR